MSPLRVLVHTVIVSASPSALITNGTLLTRVTQSEHHTELSTKCIAARLA